MRTQPQNNLCLKCGMCCDGTIFADVQLQPEDAAGRLAKLGLELKFRRQSSRHAPRQNAGKRYLFLQPCPMLQADCRCRIYADRPQHCRNFDCALLQKLRAGEVTEARATRTVRIARQRVSAVLKLLYELGDTDAHLPIAGRVRQTAERLSEVGLDAGTAQTYGRLTLAAHDLNFLLSDAFYPG